MLRNLVLLLLLCHTAQASIFSFKDESGYEKCLNTDSIEEISSDGGKMEKRWLHGQELKERCAEKAVALAERQKDGGKLLEMVELTRRKAGPQLALPLAQHLVKLKISYCNDMKVYDLILKTLQHPVSTKVAKEDFEQAKKLVASCVKDKEFKTDFIEEQSNGDSFISKNACQILQDLKIVKTCEAKK